MISRRLDISISLGCLLLAGCGLEPNVERPEAEISTAPDPLLTRVRYGTDCNPGMQGFLDQVMRYGRTAAASRAFEQCVVQAVRGGQYRRCHGDPFYSSGTDAQAAQVLAVARSTNEVAINCTGGSGNASTYLGTYGHSHAGAREGAREGANHRPM